ncbi:hypothetical protein VIGAN_06152300, partial [Vigna angularis var. angularis]
LHLYNLRLNLCFLGKLLWSTVSIRSPSINERWFLKATLASCCSSIGSKFSLSQILGYKAMSRKEPNSSCFQLLQVCFT